MIKVCSGACEINIFYEDAVNHMFIRPLFLPFLLPTPSNLQITKRKGMPTDDPLGAKVIRPERIELFAMTGTIAFHPV